MLWLLLHAQSVASNVLRSLRIFESEVFSLLSGISSNLFSSSILMCGQFEILTTTLRCTRPGEKKSYFAYRKKIAL